jgi:hypothetical protein
LQPEDMAGTLNICFELHYHKMYKPIDKH